MRCRRVPLAPLALVSIVAALPACLELQKVDPGPRLVDDFASPDLNPSWTRFDPWQCGPLTGTGPDAGQSDVDGGAVEGRSVICGPGTPGAGVGDMHALQLTFRLTAMPGNPPLGATMSTKTFSGSVDLSGFKQLVFSAYLEAVPVETQFEVELGCSSIARAPVASLTVVGISLQGSSFPQRPFQLSLDQFHQQNTAQSHACLAQVDSIRFTILLPPLASGTSTGGTLHIDNISLLN